MKQKVNALLATFFVLFTLISCPIMIFMYWRHYIIDDMSHAELFVWYVKTFWWCLLIYAAFAVYIAIYQSKKRNDKTHMP